jgi:exodeoxyribonuclease III
MRFATWNVNSLKARLPRVEEFLAYADVDVLCLQETKCSDKSFPALTFSALGYETVHHGQGQWNGVAVLSRKGIDSADHGFGDAYDDPYVGDARLLVVQSAGINFVCVYVPNGRQVGTEHYERKLAWLEVLRTWLAARFEPTDPVVVLGDFNVAPEDRDVWDPKAFIGATHVTEPERDAVRALEKWGLEDVFRRCWDQTGLYTYWDYRAGDFHQHRGMRIDLALATKPVAERASFAVVDRNARKGTQPSDHAPLIIDLAD